MSIIILYVDLRNNKTQLKEQEIDWKDGITAFEAVKIALTGKVAQQIQNALVHNSIPGLIVSWSSLIDNSISEIGGVGSLDWKIDDNSMLAITYEDEATSDQQMDESTEWMLAVYEKYHRSL